MSNIMKKLLSNIQMQQVGTPAINIQPVNDSYSRSEPSLALQGRISQASANEPSTPSLGYAAELSNNRGKYVDQLSDVESYGGDYNAVNKKSGAHGRYQIMPATYREWEKKLGMTPSYARTNAGQDKIFDAITNRNRISLMRANIPTTRLNLYGAHQQGAAGFARMYNDGVGNMENLKANGVNSVQGWFDKYGPKFK